MSKSKDIVVENLKGFVRKGASSCSPGNIPTGHFPLDFVIHHGTTPDKVDLNKVDGYDPSKPLGLPLGKLIEIFGGEGAGKSSLAYRVVGYAQKLGHACAWLDTENSFAENLATINGVNKEELYYSDMSTEEELDKVFYAEDVFDAIITLIKSGVKVIVLDSVANLVPKVRMEAQAEQRTVGVLARLMSENLGKIVNYAGSHGAMVIFINQLREKIGVFFGNPETTPGGRSLKHNCSVRIQISKKGGKEADIFIENEEGNESLIGRYARVNVRKNRMAKPYMESILVPVYYEAYFPDIEEMLFDVGRQLKLISVRKGVFKWEDSKGKEHKLDGRRAFIDYIKSNKLEFLLANSLIAKAAEVGVFLPPEITQWYMNNTKAEEGIGSDEKTSNKEGSASGRRKGKSSKVGDGDSQ